jgi:hypothetical protein
MRYTNFSKNIKFERNFQFYFDVLDAKKIPKHVYDVNEFWVCYIEHVSRMVRMLYDLHNIVHLFYTRT